MVRIEPLLPLQNYYELPTKFEFLEYLHDYESPFNSTLWSENISIDYLYDNLDDISFGQNKSLNDFLNENLEWFQSKELFENIFQEYFNDNWRYGQPIRKVVISQRLYQISPNSTQAWFFCSTFSIEGLEI